MSHALALCLSTVLPGKSRPLVLNYLIWVRQPRFIDDSHKEEVIRSRGGDFGHVNNTNDSYYLLNAYMMPDYLLI